MPDSALTRLLALAGPPLGPPDPVCPPGWPAPLVELAGRRNGFAAFWSALQVFPLGGPEPAAAAVAAILREDFGELAAGHTAFAHDLFGSLFTWSADGVHCFDPETGESEPLAVDLEGWAAALLDDPEELAGSAFAFDWQERNGALEAGERLVPLMPWVLDGDWDDANLEPRDALVSLRERAALARTVAALPDGADVEWPLPGTRTEP